MPISGPNYRLMNDPIFRHLSDAIYSGMKEGTFTPTDVREALVDASLRLERDRQVSLFILEPTS